MRSNLHLTLLAIPAITVACLSGCVFAPEHMSDDEFVGTYVSDEMGHPELTFRADGTMSFTDIRPTWFGGDSPTPVSGTGDWTSGSELHNGYTAFAVKFVAPPEVPGSREWVYIGDSDSVFLWIDVTTNQRIEFQRVDPPR